MLAGRASRQAVEDGPGPKIRDTVEQYDRRLQKWIHENVGRVGALYEAQASAFREQVRRLLSESSGDGVEEADDSMDADLDLLRQYGTTETAALAEANSMGGSGNNQ